MSALDAPARPLPAFRRRPLTPVQRTQRTVGYVLIVLLALFCLVPFAWVVPMGPT